MHQGLASKKRYALILAIGLCSLVFAPLPRAHSQDAIDESIYDIETDAPQVAPEPPSEPAPAETENADVVEETVAPDAEVPVEEIVEESSPESEPAAEPVVEQVTEPEAPQVAEEPSNAPTQDALTYPPEVEVEKTVYAESVEKCNCEYTYLKPYRERRPTWGFTFAAGYSMYSPYSYKPDFVANDTFQDYYGTAETPLVEGTLGLKWNAGFGSVSFEAGAGNYQNEGLYGSALRVNPVHLGATLTLDLLFDQPYIAPYATAGIYSAFYEETLASQKVGGNTTLGIFWAAGALFQLNWMDEEAATIAYDEQGLENAYLFAELRSFIASDTIPNLGSSPQAGAGLKLEY